MNFFPHAIVINSSMTILRRRFLPFPGTIGVRKGHRVTPVQVIGRAKKEKAFQVLRASNVLGVPAADLPNYLLVKEGEMIEKGMPLMRKEGFMGRVKLYRSPVEGILYRVSNGRLLLQHSPEVIEMRALVSGRVVEIEEGLGAILEINGKMLQGIWSSGQDSHGKLKMMSEEAMQEIKSGQIDVYSRRMIVVGGRVNELTVLQEAEASGIKGLVVGSMPAHLCDYAKELSFPVVITNGIGEIGMSGPIFDLLAQCDGLETTLFVHNWRTGHRPEILIPTDSAANINEPMMRPPPLEVGSWVRILNGSKFGQVGEVISIYNKQKALPSGIREHGVSVKFTDEDVLFVPYTNLERLI